jgi:hypothetical protein
MIGNQIKLKVSDYQYSDPIVIKKWNGGQISVIVGYLDKHPDRNVICLQKRWIGTGGRIEEQKFNIKDGTDWLKIKEAIEKLWPELSQTPTAQDIQKAIAKVSQETDLLELISKYPDLLSQIPKDINILELPEDQKESLKKLLSVGGEIANSVINKLAEQPIKDIEEFIKLLEELKLSTINSLVTHVTSRINFINMFETVIHDNNSYERRGPGSVHNLLKANMWIVDRNYSILHDDTTLKTIIAEQWGKEINPIDPAETRPDFLCMSDPFSESRGQTKLVILEIKKPTVKIKFAHMEQVMKYKTVLQKYSGKKIDDYKCYMIGREIDPDFAANDFSSSGFVCKTYTDFISEARVFYQEYLKIVEDESLAL